MLDLTFLGTTLGHLPFGKPMNVLVTILYVIVIRAYTTNLEDLRLYALRTFVFLGSR